MQKPAGSSVFLLKPAVVGNAEEATVLLLPSNPLHNGNTKKQAQRLSFVDDWLLAFYRVFFVPGKGNMPFAGRVWRATSPDANFLTACSLGAVGSRSQLGLGHPALARGTQFPAGEHNQPVGGWETGSQPCGCCFLSSLHPRFQLGLGRLLK